MVMSYFFVCLPEATLISSYLTSAWEVQAVKVSPSGNVSFGACVSASIASDGESGTKRWDDFGFTGIRVVWLVGAFKRDFYICYKSLINGGLNSYCYNVMIYLVGAFKHFTVYFPFHIWDVILPIDFHMFQRDWNQQFDAGIAGSQPG